MIFEWDADRDRMNRQKHGVSLETSSRVFFDPKRLEKYDSAHSCNEDRWIIAGMVWPNVLLLFSQLKKKMARIESYQREKPMRAKKGNTIIFDCDPSNLPSLTDGQKQELENLAKTPDSEIDYSDIPPLVNLEGFYRPASSASMIRVDNDILEWIKTLGDDREALINRLLRQQMKAALGE